MAKELSIVARKPLARRKERGSVLNWCTIVNDVRTFFRRFPEIAIPLLTEPGDRHKPAFEDLPKAA